MDWARVLAFVTGMVDQELLARIEYLAAENHLLKAQLKGRLKLSDHVARDHVMYVLLSLTCRAASAGMAHFGAGKKGRPAPTGRTGGREDPMTGQGFSRRDFVKGAVLGSVVAAMFVPAVSEARADGDPARGEQRYEDCIACHPIEPGVHGIGPSLYGIVGRKAGEVADYRYSGPLKRSGLTWTPEALDTFIADPQASVPANRMPYAGMADARDRADLIAYLQKVSK